MEKSEKQKMQQLHRLLTLGWYLVAYNEFSSCQGWKTVVCKGVARRNFIFEKNLPMTLSETQLPREEILSRGLKGLLKSPPD